MWNDATKCAFDDIDFWSIIEIRNNASFSLISKCNSHDLLIPAQFSHEKINFIKWISKHFEVCGTLVKFW